MDSIEAHASEGRDALFLGDNILVELFRGHRGFYANKADERICANDLVVTAGRVYIAKRIASGDTVASAMAYISVGTATGAAALGDTTLAGEIKRKATAINSVLANNVFTAVVTLGGFAESIQSIAITEAGVFNHASSGQGTMMQRVTFASVTLANSDLLKITLETNVGSS